MLYDRYCTYSHAKNLIPPQVFFWFVSLFHPVIQEEPIQSRYKYALSIKDKEIEELREKSKILITALEIIAESNPISIGLNEVEDLANSALTSFRDYENK